MSMFTRSVAAVVLTALAVMSAPPPAMAGEMVTKAQKRLNRLGCSSGPADGEVGTWTRSAVIRFQAANRMKQSGRLTKVTRQRLHSAQARRCDVRPVPARSGTGRRVVVSQRQNWVWLVGPKGGVIAQGGLIDNPSIVGVGTYYVGPKCGRAAKIRDNSDYSGTLRLHNFVRYAACGAGFHQIPTYWSSGAQIHANYYLGTNMKSSGGCIRLSRDMSYRMWDFTRIGTKVVIVFG